MSNFDKYWKHLKEHGGNVVPGFTVNSNNAGVHEQLLRYFLRDPACGLDLKKGICLEGNPGTGKTTTMRVMQAITGGLFRMVPTRDIVRDFLAAKENSDSVINQYTRFSYCEAQVFGYGSLGRQPRHYCFDDLGMEPTETKVFGNSIQVMREIILDRYDLMIQNGMITHATTNLKPSEIEERYDSRVRDRARQMFNLVKVYGDSLRK